MTLSDRARRLADGDVGALDADAMDSLPGEPDRCDDLDSVPVDVRGRAAVEPLGSAGALSLEVCGRDPLVNGAVVDPVDECRLGALLTLGLRTPTTRPIPFTSGSTSSVGKRGVNNESSNGLLVGREPPR